MDRAKRAHKLIAAVPIKGMAAEINLGSGIRLDRRLTICPGNSKRVKMVSDILLGNFGIWE